MTVNNRALALADELEDSPDEVTHINAASTIRFLVTFNQQLMDEVSEQCRINGMSAEREEALRAEVERLNKAIAAEREACAKIADRFSIPMCDSSADDIALLIRARGNT